MTIKIHDLKPAPGSNKRGKRVGRGIAGKGGKTAGRGTKGQKARGNVPTTFEGGQMPLHRRLPKRGFTNIFRTEYTVLNLSRLEELNESELTLDAFIAKGLLAKRDGLLKILGNGELTKPITVHAHKFSKSAQEKIEKAGGKAVVVA